jgi:hypothetical protein
MAMDTFLDQAAKGLAELFSGPEKALARIIATSSSGESLASWSFSLTSWMFFSMA